ncbi:acyl CoA:acetate/3-ketoacid CoA transferase [Enterococcus casseliflavus]|uniref:acyl CoA:acetate/3-ketoacid CoA transferase n=1 Tax=Enterococcus casseliflavus TaxID=37734 RepID=UPI001AD79604|nr:CoA-transferase [Enterococcus casseliflavus]MBO6359621.1 acyl CoA:acetate/3-ketoacid CoA transferase [Enterococcus casseliflavus]MBO6377747.1 acyl CoA:acetate/3-ketoacid CoA transferase [Enterococcus casseliflavus]
MVDKRITAIEAASIIQDNDTVCTVAMTLVGASESILKAIENRFDKSNSPKNLTILHSCGQSDRKDGLQHLAHEGLVKRIIGSHWGLQPKWMNLISENKVEAYCMPQGQIAQLYSSMACGLPGKISKVGLGTFIDPRVESGKMNELTKNLEDLISVESIQGEEYLLYKNIPIDICIIRGTFCDTSGNLTDIEEAMKLEVLPAVLATKRFGGKVIAQVKHVVENNTIKPKDVVVPGVFIDHIVECDNPLEDHRQTSSTYFNPAYSGQIRIASEKINQVIPLNERKFIARRAVMEAKQGDIVNLGTGIPNDMVGKICEEEKILDQLMITVESGIYGGIQEGGVDFGIGKNLTAMITHDSQMMFYNGTGVDITFMGLGEAEFSGHVNSTKMGNMCPGAGGFIDITQNAKKIVFCGTFTAKGLNVKFDNQKLTILNEGSVKKFVSKVGQISFNGDIAKGKNQEVIIVTERAVFKLEKDGLHLIEIAEGIDLQKDILDLMDFKPIIGEVKLIPKNIFNQEGPANIQLKEKN